MFEQKEHLKIGTAVSNIARDIDANVIVTITRMTGVDFVEEMMQTDIKATVFKRLIENNYSEEVFETSILKSQDGYLPIREMMREFVNKQILKIGDRVVVVADETVGTGFAGLIFILDVDDVFFKISRHKLTENVDPAAMDSLISIALELAKEGREGRKIGTAFIIGDKDKLSPYTKQLIYNPFQGYPIEQRKVQMPELRETIKEFSQLDGVFVMHSDGTILSAGTYIEVPTENVQLEGFGTKHRSCAALTGKEDVIAIVLSESGIVRIFKNGKIITRLN